MIGIKSYSQGVWDKVEVVTDKFHNIKQSVLVHCTAGEIDAEPAARQRIETNGHAHAGECQEAEEQHDGKVDPELARSDHPRQFDEL